MRQRHALAALTLAVAAVVATRAGSDVPPDGRPAPPAPLLAVKTDGAERWLVRLAPLTLRPLAGPRLRLEAPLEAWAQAPGGGRLAAVTDQGSRLRLLDVARMRPLGALRTRSRGSTAAVLWPRPDRLWIVVTLPGCCARGWTTVITVDPIAGRLIARRRLAGALVQVAASRDGPVLLLGPPTVIGPAALVTVDSAGRVARLALAGVSAGAMRTASLPLVERVRTPALAVDPQRQRAYVVTSGRYAVEVDLLRGRVRDHRLVARTSLLERVREFLEPSAAAAGDQVGIVRSAAWIGAGRIALSGHDADIVWHPDGRVEAERRPGGLHVMDTRDWSVHTLDEHASTFSPAAGVLLTSGAGGRGLAAYAPDGRREFDVLGGRRVTVVATAGSFVYVRTQPDEALHVVDVRRGRVIARAPGRGTALLAD